MPCFSERTKEQILDNIKDISLLADGLREMGYTVNANAYGLSFYGTSKLSGEYSQGSYSDGKLSTVDSYATPDVPTIKKFIAVANVRKNAKAHKWALTPVKGNPFAFEVQK